jgi:polysaccharide export outer membrane protein
VFETEVKPGRKPVAARRAGRRVIPALVVICVSLAARASAFAQEPRTPAPSQASVVLNPGDRVKLKIWREPDLSGDFDVDQDGIVAFPKLGRIDVRTISTDSLRRLLLTRYAESLRNPSVEVTVLRRVNVLGSVKNPGLYYLDPTTTVADALAMAGGVSPEGKQDRVQLVRDGKRLPVELSRDSRLADSPMQPGDQLRVPMRSWFSRNTGLIAAGLTSLAVVFSAAIR